jgi:hypothetical protein
VHDSGWVSLRAIWTSYEKTGLNDYAVRPLV